MNHNGRPLPARKTIRLLLVITLLAWATQTLTAQWARGADLAALAADEDVTATTIDDGGAGGAAAFVPRDVPAGATLELRGEAKVYGRDVKLKQVCRWSKGDAATFAPVADLVVARLDARRPFRVLEVNDLRKTLGEAGVNVALVRFAGPVECTVSRRDVELSEGEALDQWIQAHGGAGGAGDAAAEATPTAPIAKVDPSEPEPRAAAARQPAARRRGAAVPQPKQSPAPEANDGQPELGARTLKALLTQDVSVRLGVPADQLEIAFNPQDERVLSLGEPGFKFNVEPRRVRDLGAVEWDVTLVSDAGSREAQIRATARAWQDQVVIARPLSRGQVIQKGDVTARRALADRMPAAALLAAEQVVGQIAARELKPGTLVTAPMVEAVPLAKVGQFVTVTLNRGSVRIKSVAKAMEGGSYGETIRVRNEATRDVYQVVLTGPQQGSMAAPAGPAPEEGVASLGND